MAARTGSSYSQTNVLTSVPLGGEEVETHLRLMRAARWGYLNITGISSFRMSAQGAHDAGSGTRRWTDHIPLMRKLPGSRLKSLSLPSV